MELFSCFKKKPIRLAVVGVTTCGKSYLLYDLVHAFGYLGTLYRSKMKNGSTDRSLFIPNIMSEGKINQTELKACHQEDFYSACIQFIGSSLEKEIEFLNIPGEAFDNQQLSSQMYSNLKQALLASGNIFRVVTWKNKVTEDEEKVVELKNVTEKEIDKDNKPEQDKKTYMGRESLNAWLQNVMNYERTATRNKIISGKDLLSNIREYNIDSAMEAIREFAEQSTKLGIKNGDFGQQQKQCFFYRLYCESATDVIVCDKIFKPKSANNEDIKYNNLTDSLREFYNGSKKVPHVFIAFRGADILLQGCQESYRKLKDKLHGQFDYEPLNKLYALFSYLAWKEVYPELKDLETDDKASDWAEEYLGIPKDQLEDIKKYIKFDVDDKNMEYLTRVNSLRDHVKMRMGTGGSGAEGLLKLAYPNCPFTDTIISCIPRHVYFTATPVTTDFEIYVNDPESNNQRFINPKKEGDAQYFDELNQHCCFGTLQLLIDLINQHGVDHIKTEGELLHHMQRI